MKKHNLLYFILLAITFYNCSDKKNDENSTFTFDSSQFSTQYQPQEQVNLGVLNPNNETIDSIAYYINDTKVGATKGANKLPFALKNQKLGYQNIKAIVHFDNKTASATTRIELVSNITPKLLKYKIINTYPHDINCFTEGLEFYKDTLYESTGLKGKSFLRKYDYKTGKIFKQVDLKVTYFGEGITIINDKIYQLTWQEKTGFIYNAKNMKLEKTFAYEKDIEGWGMTNDGKYIYQTDKTEKIWKMNPDNQKMIDYVNVYAGNAKIKAINELEWIEGKIYTNVWQKDAIAVVDPKTGAVEGILDLSGLRKFLKVTDQDVLNGIAYNTKSKTIFVTGKYWDKMFEIIVFE